MTNFQYHLLHCKLYDNERLMALPVNARWLFVWLWGNRNIDAEGRQVYSLSMVKRMCFPFDAVTESDIAGYLQVLQSKRFIQLYRAEIEGEMAELVCVPKFAENQRFRPGRMSQSRLPDPDELVLSGETKATAEPVAKQTIQLVKPQLPSLLILESEIADDATRQAWEAWKGVVAGKRKRGVVAEGVLTAALQKLLNTKLVWDALTYGLQAANAKEVDVINYAIRAAESYNGENHVVPYRAPAFDSREGVFDY